VFGPNGTFTAPPATPCYGLYQLNGGTLTTPVIQRKDTNVTGIINFNGGTLKAAGSGTLISPITTAEIQSGGLTIDTAGNSPSITQVLSGGGSLTKVGAGTLNLNTNNVFTGATMVNAGALGGFGSLAGHLIVSGGSFEPGVGIGTFSVGGNAWLTNQAVFQLNKTVSPSNDLAVVTGSLNVGGTLTVTNIGTGAGSALALGDSFKLFSKPVSGSFATVILPTPPANTAWTNKLAVDGTIALIPGQPAPANLGITFSGGELIMGWPNGQGWSLQVQTNALAIGIGTNWTTIPGATSPYTNAVDTANGAVFYRLVWP
jgi:autotransporter-associated beta strand protein